MALPESPRATATVALLTYKASAKLAETLDAFLAQTDRDFEILIQDDCSPDNTPEVARAYARRDPRIRFESTPRNLGAWGNYALAVERARGDYVMWACPGDIYLPNFVATVLGRLRAEPDAVAANGISVVMHNGTVIDTEDFAGERDPERYAGLAQAKRILVKGRPGTSSRAAYGLFIHSFVKRAPMLAVLRSFEGTGPILNDRVVLSQLVFCGRLVRVNEVVCHREFNEIPASIRNANDPALQLSSGSLLVFYLSVIRQLVVSFASTKALPLRRKLFVVPLLLHYLWQELRHMGFIGLVRGIRRIVPHSLYLRLRDRYRAAASRK